jgi:MFS transporter, DHA1 family, inner membrane transport protein
MPSRRRALTTACGGGQNRQVEGHLLRRSATEDIGRAAPGARLGVNDLPEMSEEVKRALVAVFIARTAANGALRVVYPFLPAIARGLGVSFAAASSLVAVRNLGGVATPLAARLSELVGRRRLMVWAMGLIVAGCALTAGAPSFGVAGIGIILVGLAKPSFDVPMQAWFGQRVPYETRGRVFGITELTWSVALIVTVPASGFLIAATSWRAPFVLVGIFALVGAAAIGKGLESDVPGEHLARPLVLDSQRALVLVVILLFSVAAEIPFVLYGKWLETSFGLSVGGIGVFTLVVVGAELAGEGLIVAVADRTGLRKMMLAGLVVSACAYGGLAFANSLPSAVVVVVTWISAFEVTIVAAIPFVSELAVASRDRMLSLLAVVVAIGRSLGAIGAPAIYSTGGIRLAGIVSAACAVSAAGLLLRVPDARLSRA